MLVKDVIVEELCGGAAKNFEIRRELCGGAAENFEISFQDFVLFFFFIGTVCVRFFFSSNYYGQIFFFVEQLWATFFFQRNSRSDFFFPILPEPPPQSLMVRPLG